jgi:hypothetical protein
MLMEDFFEAVDRAFVQGAGRNPAPRRLDLKTPVELSLSAPESSPATPSSAKASLLRYYFPLRRLLSRTKESRICGDKEKNGE